MTPGRRERLLEVGLRLFAERGFHGTSVPEIAREAGVAQASIYRHFASKEELVNEVYRAAKGMLADSLRSVARVGGMREEFHQLWWALVAFAREQPLAFAFLELHHHGDYLDQQSRAVEMRVIAPIAEVVERGRVRGVLRQAPAAVLIVTVWGAFVGMFKAARAGYFRLDDDVCRQVEETSWAAIAAPAPMHGGGES